MFYWPLWFRFAEVCVYLVVEWAIVLNAQFVYIKLRLFLDFWCVTWYDGLPWDFCWYLRLMLKALNWVCFSFE